MIQFEEGMKETVPVKDLSRKGSIDSRIIELVNFINSQNSFKTTSSCSGRTIVFTNSETKKKGCKWIFVSHDEVNDPETIITALQSHSGSAILKFEPFVLHTQCATLEEARKLYHCGFEAGFKNSGISIGNKGKIIVAIRSTLSLEVPLSLDGRLLVSEEYITFLVSKCNEKMMDNWQKINRFYTRLQTMNDHSEDERACSRKPYKVDKSINQDSNSDVSKNESSSQKQESAVDTYYEGYHCILNDTED